MSEFRNLLQDNSLDGWKIYPRGILRYTPGTEEYRNAWAHKGRYPVITTWINGVKIAGIDINLLDASQFDRIAAERLGTRGHISLEVHDNDQMGEARWGKNAATRFRNIRIREL